MGSPDQRLRQRHQTAAAKALQYPRCGQQLDVPRDGAENRADHEDRERSEHHRAAAKYRQGGRKPAQRSYWRSDTRPRPTRRARSHLGSMPIAGNAVATMVWSATARNIGSMIEGKTFKNSDEVDGTSSSSNDLGSAFSAGSLRATFSRSNRSWQAIHECKATLAEVSRSKVNSTSQ